MALPVPHLRRPRESLSRAAMSIAVAGDAAGNAAAVHQWCRLPRQTTKCRPSPSSLQSPGAAADESYTDFDRDSYEEFNFTYTRTLGLTPTRSWFCQSLIKRECDAARGRQRGGEEELVRHREEEKKNKRYTEEENSERPYTQRSAKEQEAIHREAERPYTEREPRGCNRGGCNVAKSRKRASILCWE